MKKLIALISILSLGSGFYAKAQFIGSKELPVNIAHDFSDKYPALSKVDWEKDGKRYKATFNVDKYAHEVVYDQTGKVVSQEFALSVANLPADVFGGIKKNFPTVQVQEADQIVENGRISFKLSLKDDDNSIAKVLMAPDGRVIRTFTDED